MIDLSRLEVEVCVLLFKGFGGEND